MYTLFLQVLAVPTSSKVLVPKQISRRRLLSLHDLTISDLTIFDYSIDLSGQLLQFASAQAHGHSISQ